MCLILIGASYRMNLVRAALVVAIVAFVIFTKVSGQPKKTKDCDFGEFFSSSSFYTAQPRCSPCPEKLKNCKDVKFADIESCEKDCAKFYSPKLKSNETTRLSTPINTELYTTTTTTTREPTKGIFRYLTDLSSTKSGTSSNTPRANNEARNVAEGNTLLTWLLIGVAIFVVSASVVGILCCCGLKRRNQRTQKPLPNSKPNELKPSVAGGAASATADAQGQELIKSPVQESDARVF